MATLSHACTAKCSKSFLYFATDKEERNRYVTLNLIAGALCEFFGLMYLLDFVTSRQTESLSFQSASQFCNQDLWLSGCACNMCTVQRRARTGVCKMNQL
ncbi:uncharacterized protein LOC142577673 isoform X4 [Dermacentor variabilis]|uniref:uncharacterized protein LOC142577673 isoform X4 n=1 Tax=Dermacentor variabilis TaxID=34621 RepID=UPI003F5B1814